LLAPSAETLVTPLVGASRGGDSLYVADAKALATAKLRSAKTRKRHAAICLLLKLSQLFERNRAAKRKRVARVFALRSRIFVRRGKSFLTRDA
jgi:hypothetical protein